MKEKLIQKPLCVKSSSIHGYGVFAAADIASGEIIEECSTILCKLRNPDLENYQFKTHDDNLHALALGFGSIYNHSLKPNATFSFSEEHSLIIFKALKNIKAGDEILVSYGKDWFSERMLPIIEPSFKFKLTKFLRPYGIWFRFLAVVSVLCVLIFLMSRR